eukprot:scaffold5693_cov141-Skeletonema_menzelii.AAC.10
MKKLKEDENDNGAISDEPSYRVISVSSPKQELTLSFPNYRHPNAARSQETITTDQHRHSLLHSRQGKQDESVEARISLDLGIEAMTQTDDAPLADPAVKVQNIDDNPSEKTYDERLNSLTNELAEIRSLFERI